MHDKLQIQPIYSQELWPIFDSGFDHNFDFWQNYW